MSTEYLFKPEFDITYPFFRTQTKNFKSLKVLRQWQKRNEIDNSFVVFKHMLKNYSSSLNT